MVKSQENKRPEKIDSVTPSPEWLEPSDQVLLQTRWYI